MEPAQRPGKRRGLSKAVKRSPGLTVRFDSMYVNKISEQEKKAHGNGLATQVDPLPEELANTFLFEGSQGGLQGRRDSCTGKVSMDTLDAAGQHTDNKDQASGTLNPAWVEWLMGYRAGSERRLETRADESCPPNSRQRHAGGLECKSLDVLESCEGGTAVQTLLP